MQKSTSVKLYQHQQDILDLNPARHTLVWGCGVGKTLGAIELAKKNTPYSTLVICPKGLVENWKRQVAEYGWAVFSKEQFKKFARTLPKFNGVIVDECHYFLGTKSQLMKSLYWYLNYHDITYRWFLSGTVYRSSPMDIYILLRLLGQEPSYQEFKHKYFYDVRMGHKIIPMVRKGVEKDLADLVRTCGSVVRMEDCIDMPPAIYEQEYFTLTPDQKKGMKEVADIMPIIRYTKYHQICGGSLKGDEYTENKTFKSDKLERVRELASEIPKLIIVCRYNNEVDNIRDTLLKDNHHVEIIRGDVKDRQGVLDRLKERENYVLVVNAAVSEGWELPNCDYMIFYSYSFSLKDKIQMEARIRRINNPKTVTYITLLIKDTIDEAVKASLDRKEDFNMEIYSKEN